MSPRSLSRRVHNSKQCSKLQHHFRKEHLLYSAIIQLCNTILSIYSHFAISYCAICYQHIADAALHILKNNPATGDALLLEWETLSNSSFSPILHALHPISTVSTALTIMRKQLSQNRQCPMCMELRMATCGKCATYKRRTRAYHYISQKKEM